MTQRPPSPLRPANPDNDGRDEGRPSAAPYYRVYADDDGQSRLERCEMRGLDMQSVGGAAPQWQNPLPDEVEAVDFVFLPVGWVGEWHESPKPQWAIPLPGRWFTQTQDGTRVEIGPGDVHFGEGIGCEPDADGDVGHLSGAVGDDPRVRIMVQIGTDPTRNRPCRFG